MDKKRILDRIKEALNFKTDTELASFLGINKSTLSNWYNRNSLDFDVVFSKCEHISPEWLLTGRGSMLRISADSDTAPPLASTSPPPICEGCKDKSARIADLQNLVETQRETIETQRETIKLLRELSVNKSITTTAKKADLVNI